MVRCAREESRGGGYVSEKVRSWQRCGTYRRHVINGSGLGFGSFESVRSVCYVRDRVGDKEATRI